MPALAIFDTRIPDYSQLFDGLPEGTDVLQIDPTRDGIEQIDEYLAGRTNYDTLQIFSHDESGTLFLGSTEVTVDTLTTKSSLWQSISKSLTANGGIHLYGGNVTQGDTGQALIPQLAQITMANVAAATHLTSNTLLGGDSALGTSTGAIEPTDTLPPPDVTDLQDTPTWCDTISNATLKDLIIQGLSDNCFSFQEVFSLLQTTALDGVTSTEFNDLQTFYSSSTNLFSTDYLCYISNAVINGNPANQTWWGGTGSSSSTVTIENLSAGSSETVAERLIDEWFKGLDLPMPNSGNYSFSYGTATGPLFVDGVAASDINQGYLGDCYLVASMGSIASSQPNYIYDAFTENENGTYGVRFFYNGQAIYTTVNTSIPTYYGSVAFASNMSGSLSGENWTSLMEKAYVQANAQYNLTTESDRSNNYSVIEGGLAYPIREITNLGYTYYSSYYSIYDSLSEGCRISTDSSAYKNTIISALSTGSIVWLASFGNTDVNGKQAFVSSHAYMVLGYNSSTDTFTIRNPWGGTINDTYLPEFQAHIEDFWNSTIKGVVAISDSPIDLVPPTLMSLTPADDTTNVAPYSDLVMTFSESVEAGSGNILIYNSNGSLAQTISISDQTQVSFSGNTVTINPASDLASSSSYYVNIGAGVVQDMHGNDFVGINGSTSYNFTTGLPDTIAPTLSSLSPADNATDVAVESNLRLTFNEAVRAGSGNILIYTGDGTLARSISVTDTSQVYFSSNTVTINPSSDLDPGTSYYVNLGSGVVITDRAGNAYAGISGSTAYNFTTAAIGSDDYADSITDTTAPMGNLAVGSSATGNIETGGDHDQFQVSLTAGTTYTIELKGANTNSGTLSDPYLRLRNSSGYQVAYNDDGGYGLNSLLTFTPTSSGTYYVDAAHYSSGETGTYLVNIVDPFNGTDGNDILIGDANVNHLHGFAGNDRLYGMGGDDTLSGGLGNDLLEGGAGNDLLDGGAGKDTLRGGLGDDSYLVDLVRIGTAIRLEDVISEGSNAGMETVQVRAEEGVVYTATPYTLTLRANLEDLDITMTGSNRINLSGNALNNTLIGNDADNLLNGKSGIDDMAGGLGNDTFVLDNEVELATLHEEAGEGVDQLRIAFKNSSTTVTKSIALTGDLANFEQITLLSTGLFNLTGNTADNILTGNTANNILTGLEGNDSLYGLAGNDSLLGGDGDDLLDGGVGIDTMAGGQGKDFYLVDNIGDIVSEGNGEGIDTIQSSITYSLVDTDKAGPDGGNVENLILGGISAINGTGNDLNNILAGNKAANKLDGGVGNDTLIGGLGNDTLTGGGGADLFVFDTALNASRNKDTIIDMIHGEDLISLDQDIFTKLSSGALDTANFLANTNGKAGDSDDFIVYNTTTGGLFYDADGSGSGAAVQFAIISTKPTDITAGDFLVSA